MSEHETPEYNYDAGDALRADKVQTPHPLEILEAIESTVAWAGLDTARLGRGHGKPYARPTHDSANTL